MRYDDAMTGNPKSSFALDASEIVEVPLLLPGWQMSALERAAYLRGITAAEMVRQLLREFIADQPET